MGLFETVYTVGQVPYVVSQRKNIKIFLEACPLISAEFLPARTLLLTLPSPHQRILRNF
jgi:hypothetical protein